LKRLKRDSESGTILAATSSSSSIRGFSTGKSGPGQKLPVWLIPILIVAVVAAGIGFVFMKRGHALTEKDSILICRFRKHHRRSRLRRHAQESARRRSGAVSYLNVFPDQKIRQTLQFMGRSPGDRITPTSAAKSASAMASRPC